MLEEVFGDILADEEDLHPNAEKTQVQFIETGRGRDTLTP